MFCIRPSLEDTVTHVRRNDTMFKSKATYRQGQVLRKNFKMMYSLTKD